MAAAAPRSVGEIETFITMLQTACRDDAVYRRLERLLAMPDRKRQAVVRSWTSDLLIAEAPPDFIQAVACLVDDKVAEKAYEVIYRCRTDQLEKRSTSSWLGPSLRGLAWFVVFSAVVIALCGVAYTGVEEYRAWTDPRLLDLEPGPASGGSSSSQPATASCSATDG
jgi:hypothetical protein